MTELQPSILVIDDTPASMRYLTDILSGQNFRVRAASSGKQALASIAKSHPQLILLDIVMPDMDGFEVCEQLQQNPETEDIPIIFISAKDEVFDKVKAFSLGAVDYVTKPFQAEEVLSRVNTHLTLGNALNELKNQNRLLLEAATLKKEVSILKESLLDQGLKQPSAFTDCLTSEPNMLAIFHYIEAIAKSNEPILVSGQTGVGKGCIVEAIYKTCQKTGKLVTVNVAGFDEHMFSDVLFGHTKGAFTGANSNREGLIAQAEGGVLFLDEIGDLSPASQIKLLQFIQERIYFPLGSDQPRKTSARVFCATNKDLTMLIKQGCFREDLYYRLNTHHIEIPSLRDRKSDIPLLLNHFIRQAADKMDIPMPSYSESLINLLGEYHFPGNVRELRALVFDAVAQNRGDTLDNQSFSSKFIPPSEQQPSTSISEVEQPEKKSEIPSNVSSLLQTNNTLPTLKAAENFLIDEAMKIAKNNQGTAATILGISRTALNKRLSRRKTSDPSP